MPEFQYTARDRTGRAATGVLEAADERELRYMLRANELFVTSLKPLNAQSGNGEITMPEWVPWNQTKLQDLVVTMRELASLVRAGLPLSEAIEIVRVQTTKPALQRALAEISAAVSAGASLSHSLAKHPRIFSPLVIALIEAGEHSGTLDDALEVVSEQLDREAVLRQKVKLALAYPKLIVITAIGTVTGMLVFVVPVFKTVYAQFKGELPGPTKMLLALSHFVTTSWWMLVLLGVGLFLGYKNYSRTDQGRRVLDQLILKAPVLGPVMRKMYIARFVHTLASAFHGGIPVLSALAISANTAGNTRIQEAVLRAAQNVRDGATVASELGKTGEFPPMVTRMVAAGEATGNVDEMLEEIRRFYERDVSYAVDQLSRLLEPAMTIVMGGLVLLILLALYMPVFNLGKVVK